jgi:hypothetical protein
VLSRRVHHSPVVEAYPPRRSGLARNATHRRRWCEKPTVAAHHGATRHAHRPGATAPASILLPEPSPTQPPPCAITNAQPLPLHTARRHAAAAANHHLLRRCPHHITSIHGASRQTMSRDRCPGCPRAQQARTQQVEPTAIFSGLTLQGTLPQHCDLAILIEAQIGTRATGPDRPPHARTAAGTPPTLATHSTRAVDAHLHSTRHTAAKVRDDGVG